MKKRALFFMVLSLGVVVVSFVAMGCNQGQEIKKIKARNALQRQAKRSAKAGDLDKAVKLYKQALKPEFINSEHEKSTAMGALREIYKVEKKYSDALDAIHWFFINSATGKPTPSALDEELEINALIQYQLTNSPASIHAHIEYIKESNKDYLPPIHYSSVGTTTTTSDILRLYDTIGDYDAGIAFADEILKYWEKKSGQNLHLPGNKNQYFLIRQAFEREKANGGPTCGKWGAKDANGVYCIGDATQALIQSDYFPW